MTIVKDTTRTFEVKKFIYSLLKPGVSGLRAGLQILSRSPSSLVCPSIDSSLAGGESDAQAGLDESVRNDSLPAPPVLVELFPEPNSKPLNFENFYRSVIPCTRVFISTHILT